MRRADQGFRWVRVAAALALWAAAPARAAEAPAAADPVLRRARHILVTWQGAVRAPPKLARTKEEARRRAREALARARAGEEFAALVLRFSDEPGAAARGGELGTFAPDALVQELARALAGLAPLELAPDPVESPFGFHVLQRLPDVETYRVRHLVVAWRGALRARPGVSRSREEAHARARELAARLAQGADFAELARAHSDDEPTAKDGGDVGPLRSGLAVPAFEQTALALAPGQVSAPVETPMGVHLIQRLP